jgi:hypothetical protein
MHIILLDEIKQMDSSSRGKPFPGNGSDPNFEN